MSGKNSTKPAELNQANLSIRRSIQNFLLAISYTQFTHKLHQKHITLCS